MKKIVVGILPQTRLKTNDNPYDDKYEFLDLYSKKIIECGAIPVGICLNEGKLDYSSLEICDAFILPGGNKIWPYYYETISYAIKNNKPLLGICLGFHGLAIYSCVLDNIDGELTQLNFKNAYEKLKEKNDNTLLNKIESPNMHGDIIVNYENVDDSKHNIKIIAKDSILYDIYKKDKLNVVSLHGYTPKWIGSSFKATAKANDGILEAIEYNSNKHFIVGVQYHPEWDNDNLLFKRLIEEGEKRKNE